MKTCKAKLIKTAGELWRWEAHYGSSFTLTNAERHGDPSLALNQAFYAVQVCGLEIASIDIVTETGQPTTMKRPSWSRIFNPEGE